MRFVARFLVVASFLVVSAAARAEGGRRFVFSVGGGLAVQPLPANLLGFFAYSAAGGVFVLPNSLLTVEATVRPRVGSDYSEDYSASTMGVYWKHFFADVTEEPDIWAFYFQAGIESTSMTLVKPTGSSSSSRRWVEGESKNLMLGTGIQKFTRNGNFGLDFLRARIPFSSSFSRDDGGIDGTRDAYFKNQSLEIARVHVGINF